MQSHVVLERAWPLECCCHCFTTGTPHQASCRTCLIYTAEAARMKSFAEACLSTAPSGARLPRPSSFAGTAVVEQSQAGTALSDPLGLELFVLGHTQPANFCQSLEQSSSNKSKCSSFVQASTSIDATSRKFVSIANRPPVVTPNQVPPLSTSRPANKEGASCQKCADSVCLRKSCIVPQSQNKYSLFECCTSLPVEELVSVEN